MSASLIAAASQSATSPKSPSSMTDLKTQPLAILAIDFGTARSGCAYAYCNDPHRILTDQSSARGNVKVLTAILFDPAKKFKAFAEDARTKYANLTQDEQKKYYYLYLSSRKI